MVGTAPADAGAVFVCWAHRLFKRDKVNLDIFWLKDKSLEESEDLPEPGMPAREIDDLQAALDQFHSVTEELR